MSDSVAAVKELRSYQQLQSARRWIWGWNAFLFLYLVIWQWPSLTMVPLRHTFLLSTPSAGSLKSDWWSVDHFITLFILMLWLIPFTLAFASDSPLTGWRRMLHLVLTFVLFLVALTIMAWWIYQWEKANDPVADNANNPANDPRWCCVNFVLSTDRCHPVNAGNLCNPSPGQADLVVAPMFLYRFWFLVVFLLLMVLDIFVIVKGIFERAIAQYRREALGEEEEEAPSGPAGVFNFRVPLPSAPPPAEPMVEDEENPPLYNAKGQPYCPRVPTTTSMKDQLRAAAARQQQLKVAAGAGRYFGKNSKR